MGERFPPPSHPPISPAQCSTCQPFAASLLQSGMLHKTQTNKHRVSKNLLFYNKIDEIDINDNILIFNTNTAYNIFLV